MITRFKIFETSIYVETPKGLDKGEPEKGDYVICTNKYWSTDQNKFFLSKIGQITNITLASTRYLYSVRYEEEYTDTPTYKRRDGWGNNSMQFWRNEITHWSKNKEDLEEFTDLYGDVFKYNL